VIVAMVQMSGLIMSWASAHQTQRARALTSVKLPLQQQQAKPKHLQRELHCGVIM
jgi:hypothetical protein